MRFLTLLLMFALPLQATAPVVAVTLNGVVHPITVEIIHHAIAQAERDGAPLLLLRINTPGGLLESARLIDARLVASKVPVAVYVTPSGGRAASAGFFLLESADIAAMAPGTNTGAASPVLIGQTMDPVMRNKIENDTSAAIRSLAEKRGRNAALAEKAIREAKAFTEKEALEANLIDLIAKDETDLLRQLDGRVVKRFDGTEVKLALGGVIANYELSARERLYQAISDPDVGFVLFALGALGVYVEFTTPGLILPGVAGGILAILGLSSLTMLPINFAGVGLLLLAIAFFALEAKFASHGVLGTGGAVAMVLGAVTLVNGPPEMRIHLPTALAVTLPFALITVLLVSLVLKARANKVITGIDTMIDEIGVALTDLMPDGQVRVRGEYWNAFSIKPVTAGSRIRVAGIQNFTLQVEEWK